MAVYEEKTAHDQFRDDLIGIVQREVPPGPHRDYAISEIVQQTMEAFRRRTQLDLGTGHPYDGSR